MCDGDRINLGITSSAHRHFALNYSLFSLQLLFRVTNHSNWTSIKYLGATMNTSKVHINNMYIIYTFVHFAILLIRQVSRAVPLRVTISFAVEALSFRLDLALGFFMGVATCLPFFLKFPFFPFPFYLKLVFLSTINTWCFSWFLPSPVSASRRALGIVFVIPCIL